MYVKFNHTFHDSDLAFLREFVALLDLRFDQIQEDIEASPDPDQMGHFDDAEYVAGIGFSACQRYLASTCGPHGVAKNVALDVGPRHNGGETIARIVNASANYWKHVDEWDFHSAVLRDRARLQPIQLETIRVIETVTPWDDYACTNLLASLTDPEGPRLKYLLPKLEAWRNAFDDAFGG